MSDRIEFRRAAVRAHRLARDPGEFYQLLRVVGSGLFGELRFDQVCSVPEDEKIDLRTVPSS
ncbi:MAG: hypothetical protein WD492_01290 [Alkalispirochaeta sp.]